MIKRKTYSGSFKAKVISDLILKRKELNDLANDYQLHPNQIKNWRTLLFKRAHIILDDKRHNKNDISFIEAKATHLQ
jgi:transposase